MPLLSINALLKWLLIISISLLILHFGSFLFVPMLYGLLVAFVMYPLCLWMERRGIHKTVSITISLSIVILLFVALIGLLGWQLQLFRKDMPEILVKVKPALAQFREWLQTRFLITIDMQDEWLHQAAMSSGDKISSILNKVFNATVSTLFMLFLIPIYAALFLYHRSVFVRFIEVVAGANNRLVLRSILQQTINTYSNYIKGMVAVYLIVGILNSIGLLVLGIRHAILFGMVTAIMTIIPYIGIIISALLPISMAYIMKDSIWYPIGVIAVFSFVQYLEGNIIFPTVVGKQLNVSTWATLVAIMAGGIIWGVSGMILFIPFVAILKIIAEHIPEWKPIYILLNRD